MDSREWIDAFSAELGITPPDEATVEALLDLAGVAAHASERTAAPITCWLIGQAGMDVDTARRLADELAARGLMRRTRFDEWDCPIARVTDLMGDWWTPLVLRECFYGRRRFDEFVDALGIPRPVLSKRLARLVDDGLLEKHQYEQHPPRWEYRLTDKGRASWDVLAAMWRYGMDWQWNDDDPPLTLVDRATGAEVVPVVVDENTGDRLDVRRVRLTLR